MTRDVTPEGKGKAAAAEKAALLRAQKVRISVEMRRKVCGGQERTGKQALPDPRPAPPGSRTLLTTILPWKSGRGDAAL